MYIQERKTMSIIFSLSLILGIFSLVYYGIIIAYAGIGSSFSWFWLLAGIGCLIFCIILRYIIRNEIRVPDFIKLIFFSAITIGLSIFILIEGTLISYSTHKADSGMDYLIVLGAQVRGTRITKALQKRLDTAASYLKENPETMVIVSGGQGTGEDISEAEAMKRYLNRKGIDNRRILQENKSTSTYENILYSKELVVDQNSSVAIVTNGFHIYRALGIAKKQGMKKIQGLAAPTDQILLFNYYVREAAGVLKDKLFGNL
jgi:uncharacterized SAM-binding protein YcdF (DUF218 family)